jgi:hypothetical protein
LQEVEQVRAAGQIAMAREKYRDTSQVAADNMVLLLGEDL